MSVLLDTNVVVADVRSRSGSSNPLLVSAFHGRFQWCCSVPLFYEYEDVLGRADFLLDTRTSRHEIEEFLTDVARTVVPVELHFLWRPQLYDPADEMVLETAVNAGAAAIVAP